MATHPTPQQRQQPLDTALFSTLLPSLLRLSQLASSPSPSPSDDDPSQDPKLALNTRAAALHSTLDALAAQARTLPAAHLSVDDQAWLEHQLHLELDRTREHLEGMARQTALEVPEAAPAVERDATGDKDTAMADGAQA